MASSGSSGYFIPLDGDAMKGGIVKVFKKKKTELQKEKENLLKVMSTCKRDTDDYEKYARAYKALCEAEQCEGSAKFEPLRVVVPIVACATAAVVKVFVVKAVTSYEETDVITSKVNQFIHD